MDGASNLIDNAPPLADHEPVRVVIEGGSAGVILPPAFSLQQNYPNPFNPATTIVFSIPRASRVRMSIYDLLGREITPLVRDVHYRAGVYSTAWNGTNARGAPVGSGVYLYRITATPLDGSAPYVEARKMLLMW